MKFNPHDEMACIKTMFACAANAVQTGFQHLPIRFVLDPPHGHFDAWLARQIAIRIVAVDMDVARGQVGRLLGCHRVRVSLCVVAVNKRLDEPVFDAAYTRMSRLALDLYAYELQKAKAA